MYLDASGVKLAVSVLAEDTALDAAAVKRYLSERYEEDGAEVTEPGAATSTATYRLRIVRVFDDLVPESSKILLCQGTCEVEVVHEGKEILKVTLHSKVTSGEDRETIHRTITDYLKQKAYEEAARALDEALYE